MQANPIWPVTERFPTLQKDISKDVLVVGGGMAGVCSAFQLKKAGYDVAAITRDEVGGPATGASSGVLYYGSGTNFAPAIELFGEKNARLMWKETAEVIEDISSAVKSGGFDCGFRRCGSIMVAKTDAEVQELEDEFAKMKTTGLPVRLLSSEEVAGYYPKKRFLRGLAYDGVGQIHPARVAAGVAREEGLEVYEQTAMTGWEESAEGVVVRTPAAEIRSMDVVIATNFEPVFGLEEHFDVESSVILASKPTGKVSEVFPEEKIFWTMEEKYDLMYPRGDRLILEMYYLGEEDTKLPYYFPGAGFETDQQWGEAWAKTKDWVPILGKVSDHVAVQVAMGDQGIIMSWLTGSKVPMLLKGEKDWFTELASPKRFVQKTMEEKN